MARYTVVLADDSADDSLIIRRAFECREHALVLASLSNAQQLVEYLTRAGGSGPRQKTRMPDLLILDLWTPKRTSFDALEQVLAAKLPVPQVIAVLTGVVRPGDILRAHALGVHFVASKQPNLKPFIGRIERALIPAMCGPSHQPHPLRLACE